MEKLGRYGNRLEAQLVGQLLNAHGIATEIVGAKDYTSILLGSDMGSFDLMVPSERLFDARELLKQDLQIVRDQMENTIPLSDNLQRPELYLKKAVLYSIIAMLMLPIIFNYYSLRNLKLYLNKENNQNKKIVIALLILLLQIPTIIIAYFFLKAAFGNL